MRRLRRRIAAELAQAAESNLTGVAELLLHQAAGDPTLAVAFEAYAAAFRGAALVLRRCRTGCQDRAHKRTKHKALETTAEILRKLG